MKIRGVVELIAGFAVTAVTVFFAFRALGGIDVGALFSAGVNWYLAALSGAIFIASTFIRGLGYTLGIDRGIGFYAAWRIVAVGNAANLVLPLRAGEGMRLAFYPGGYSALDRTRLTALPAVADVSSILVISISAVLFAGFKDPALVRALNVITLCFVSACLAAFGALIHIKKTRALVARHLNKGTVCMAAWVGLSWAATLVSIWVGLIAFGYTPARSAGMSVAVFAGTSLAMFIPASPGGIGVFEYAVIVSLSGLGVAAGPAKILGLLLHFIQYASLLPLGLLLYLIDPKRASAGAVRPARGPRRRVVSVLKK